MAKPRTIHTLESLYELTTEEGDCRLWNKYSLNYTPMVYQGGKMISVRKLILSFECEPWGSYFAAKCGNPLCVLREHISQRTEQQHCTRMAKNVSQSASNHVRIAKITKARRLAMGKITQEIAAEIRMSDETGPVLAERYGVTRTMVSRIRRGESWTQDFSNPFQGMFTSLAANDSGRKRA